MKALQHHKYDRDRTAKERRSHRETVEGIICRVVGREDEGDEFY